MVRIKRAYEPARPADGHRVLVDRLWPRGVSKERAHLDEWLKDIAPSDALRKWFGHDPRRWEQFRERYLRELRAPRAHELLEGLVARARAGTVTLVYAAHDELHNDAVVLAEELARRMGRSAKFVP
ncbi:MAG TPA: DUF488 domain-containing protein [Polyangiaceae bacterium]|nr:DUF488 domain-containing protein [Polyangiaceae bacterium]